MMGQLFNRLKVCFKQVKRLLKWTNRSFRGKWIPAGFCLALVLMALISSISYRNANRLTRNAAQLQQSNEILQVLSSISLTLAYTEFRRSNHTLLRSLEALKEDKAEIDSLEPQLDQLKQLAFYRQRHCIEALTVLIDRREALFQALIEQRHNPQNGSSQTLITQVKQNQTDIRSTIVKLQTNEKNFLANQAEYFQTGFENRLTLEQIGTFSTFMLLFCIYGLVYYQKVKRQQAEAKQYTLVQAKVLSELKLQFFSMVSHEFRTPLSHILGSAQLLGETLKPLVEPERLKNLYRIQASAKLMTQLLNDVLTLARADAGKLEYNPSQVEMQSFCLNLIEDFQSFSESQHSIQFFQRGDRTHAWVDERLLYSILSNLLSNAIKYSPSLSTIEFTLRWEPGAVTFQVKDEGIGIPAEDILNLYNSFVRGSNTKAVLGSGLGLAIVKKCLDLHQGNISVESQVEGGTTFTVTIPQPKERELNNL